MSAASRFFAALGDETRLALLEQLRAGEKTVGALVAALGCPQPKVSRHLKVLKDAGLVRDRREGRNVTYELATPARWDPAARRWVDRLEGGLGPPGLATGARQEAPKPGADVPPQRREDIETYLL